MEIEIKLDASGMPEEKVWSLFGITQTKRKEMSAVYYDDADGTLRQNGIALRLRKENGEGVLTVKQRLSGEGGFSRRGEWECSAGEIVSGVERLDTGDSGVKDLVLVAVKNGLVPIAAMSFTRRSADLTVGNSEIEIAYDEGLFNRETAFCEVELELKSGAEGDLVSAANRLEQELGLRPQPLSKLSRAIKRDVK